MVTTTLKETMLDSKIIQKEKDEIINFFSYVKDTISSLSFSQLINNQASITFAQKHNLRIKNLATEIENFNNNDYLVSIVGEFSVGKSTLINALLGIDILPANVQETTCVVTKIKYDEECSIKVLYSDGTIPKKINFDKNELFNYLCKKGKSYSEKIIEIRITVPSDILKNGITLIDTPGLGSSNEVNNQRAIEVMSRSNAIIMAIGNIGGRENLELIKNMMLWNSNNQYPVIFAITHKDKFNTHKDKKDALEGVVGLIEQAKEELQLPNIGIPHMCMISSYYELHYKLFKSGLISQDVVLSQKGLHLRNIEKINELHNESGFEEFLLVLNKTILKSNIRLEQIKQILLSINKLIGEINFDLNDYLRYYEHYETLEQLEVALNAEIDAIREIEEKCFVIVSRLEERIKVIGDDFKRKKINDLKDSIYCELVQYINENDFEIIASNKYAKLEKQRNIIVNQELRHFYNDLSNELNNETIHSLEEVADIIKRATKSELISPTVEYDEDQSADLGDLKVNTSFLGKSILLSLSTLPAAVPIGIGVGQFVAGQVAGQIVSATIGQIVVPIPVLGSVIGGVVFGGMSMLISTIKINDKYSEKKIEKLKQNLEKYLTDLFPHFRKIITSQTNQYTEYCKSVKSFLSEKLHEKKKKRDSMLVDFESENKNVAANKQTITADLTKIKPLHEESSLLLAKHTYNEYQNKL
ncbi:MAG: Bacterial dynamin-like protein [Firmicutes bacterium ADurb.Bin193]|nr:MAG: Bacterial dynamin-like protein [Firmicutes bacterium ADurb.Bin193]